MKEDPVVVAKKLLKDSTPGPWCWRIVEHLKLVELVSGFDVSQKVVEFDRWGMASGTPKFMVNGKSKKAFEFAKQFNQGFCPTTIDHPDANLIAQAPEIIRALMEEVLRLRGEITK